MEYPPEPYPPIIRDSGDTVPATRVYSFPASSAASTGGPRPSGGHCGDDDSTLCLTNNPPDSPHYSHDEEILLHDHPPIQSEDTYPDLVLPSMLQAPAEIFHGSRNAPSLLPDIYCTQDSLPSTPSSYSASPKTPAQSQGSFTSSPKVAGIEARMMIGVKRPYDHISSTPAHDQPMYRKSTPENIQKPRPVNKTPLRHRPTPASVAASHKKLSTPFRSPMLIKSAISNTNDPAHSGLSKRPKIFSSNSSLAPHDTTGSLSMHVDIKKDLGVEDKPEPKELKRLRILANEPVSRMSKSVSKPFKSPLLVKNSSTTSSSSSGSHSTGMEKRKIQALEKTLHLLRQAKKIRLARTIESLEADARKWKTAARQAAEELWSLVQSNSSGGMAGGSSGSSYADHSDPHSSAQDSHRNNSFSNSYGWATTDVDDRGDDVLAQLKGGGLEADWGWANATSSSSGPNQQGYHAEGSGGESHSEQYEESMSEPPSPSTLLQQLFRPYRGAGKDASNGKPNEWKSVIPENDNDGTEYEIGNELRAGAGQSEPEQDEDKEPEHAEYNVGAMLASFGIDAKGTLGWDDAEGDFMDS